MTNDIGTVKDSDVQARLPELDVGGGPPDILVPPPRNGGNGSHDDSDSSYRNSFIGVLLFIGADIMLFSGLIGSFIVFRYGAEVWPPPGQPRLPVGITGANTAILLASGASMIQAWRQSNSGTRAQITRNLNLTLALGTTFLLVQGYEWARLIEFGLRMSSDVFAASFYTLIGCHALHVAGAVIWLLVVTFNIRAGNGSLQRQEASRLKLIGMYWYLVVALWPVLFGLVYLG